MLFGAEEDSQKFISLQNHLAQLLNARKGSVRYLPNYGLSDLNEIYQKLPESMGDLVSEVKYLISRYEPRLANVNIIPYLSHDVDCVVYLKLQATFLFCSTPINFETYFLSGGEARVQWTD
jgi:type VI secretion system protein